MITRREPSQRKAARERYLASASAERLHRVVAPAAPAMPAEPALTERVRTLYESGVVPVREIARLVGVGERQIYRYAQKLGWKARVRWLKPVARGRARLPLPDVRALYEASRLTVCEIAELAGVSDVTINNYARKLGWRRRARSLAKGAGGRFVRRAEAGLPHVCGLKALDPAGARHAAERCARAVSIADAAAAAAAEEAQARAARLAAQREAAAALRTFERLNASLVELAKFRSALGGAPGSDQAGRADRLATRLEHAILAQIERLLAPAGGGTGGAVAGLT
jgi:transcriptional regulator with XRE-family HTH domain